MSPILLFSKEIDSVQDSYEDHTTIWCVMGDIMNKLVSHGSVLDNLELDFLIKESR